MARRGGSGGKAGTDNLLATVAGGVVAVILDFTANSIRIPGFNESVYKITPAKTGGKTVAFTSVDYAQMGLSVALGSYGFSAGTASRIPAFAWGMLLTQIITKIGFPSLGIPRYLAFEIDSQGRLAPVGKFS